MSSLEFAEWMAFERMEPGEPLRTDYNFAMIAFVVCSVLGGKRAKHLRIEDFLLKFEDVETDEDRRKKVMTLVKQWLSGQNEVQASQQGQMKGKGYHGKRSGSASGKAGRQNRGLRKKVPRSKSSAR